MDQIVGYEDAHNAPGLVIDKKRAVDDGHRGWLYSVAVHPAHRKSGWGGGR